MLSLRHFAMELERDLCNGNCAFNLVSLVNLGCLWGSMSPIHTDE